MKRRRRSKLGEERAIAGERERKREIEGAREVHKDQAILLEPTGRQAVARLGCVARGRERQRAPLQRREVEGGADRRGPPVSGGGEAARSDAERERVWLAQYGTVGLGRERPLPSNGRIQIGRPTIIRVLLRISNRI